MSRWRTFGICPPVLGASATVASRAAVATREAEFNNALATECTALVWQGRCRWDGGTTFGYALRQVRRVDRRLLPPLGLGAGDAGPDQLGAELSGGAEAAGTVVLPRCSGSSLTVHREGGTVGIRSADRGHGVPIR